MLVIRAVLALGMAIIGVGVIRGAAAAEAGPSLPLQPLPLMNRQEPSLLETDGRVGDREQLRRYSLQDRRDWLMR
jgi:hypothetical protein